MSQDLLTTRMPARPESVAVLRRAAVEAARAVGMVNGVLSSVCLAVSEAATNAVLHAYPEGEPGEIGLDVRVDPDSGELVLDVCDDGCGLRPRTDSPGLGLGLPVISTVARRVDIHTPAGGGTVVRMWFSPTGLRTPPAPFARP